MDIALDITQEFEELKTAFSCSICKKLLVDPIVLKTCDHTVCRNCLDGKKLRCPVCKSAYNERDIEEDLFTSKVLPGIENIQKFSITNRGTSTNANECSALMHGYRIVTLQTVMRRNPKGETPLHLACKRGQVDKVNELLEKVVDINMTDYANWTAVHEAVECKSYDCCNLLLENGALPDVPGECYTTPLHKAVTLNSTDIAELLLRYGANRDNIDYFGRNAFNLSTTDEMTSILRTTKQEVDSAPSVYVSPFVVVFYLKITKEHKDQMLQMKAKFVNFQDFSSKGDTTHLVVTKGEKLNLNILLAVLKGIFIVQEEWIEDYIATGNRVSFEYVLEKYKETVEQSVRNRWQKNPKLFDGINFHIIDHEEPSKVYNVNLTKKDLIMLIDRGGGKHVIRPPALRTVEDSSFFPYHVDRKSELTMCCNYIIYNETKPPELLYKMKELRHKSSRWLIDCILNFSIRDV